MRYQARVSIIKDIMWDTKAADHAVEEEGCCSLYGKLTIASSASDKHSEISQLVHAGKNAIKAIGSQEVRDKIHGSGMEAEIG